jgi:uncharacterized membrane protein YeaQ/YmgE (transglycosylase-associated protein family)
MEWTLTNLGIQTVAGFVGAHAAAGASHEHNFGLIGHSLVGLVGGAISGYFLQTAALTMVTGSGSLMEPRAADVFIIQGLTGAIVGAICMFAVGFALQHKSTNAGK